jgi:hypothetical protein
MSEVCPQQVTPPAGPGRSAADFPKGLFPRATTAELGCDSTVSRSQASGGPLDRVFGFHNAILSQGRPGGYRTFVRSASRGFLLRTKWPKSPVASDRPAPLFGRQVPRGPAGNECGFAGRVRRDWPRPCSAPGEGRQRSCPVRVGVLKVLPVDCVMISYPYE